MFKLAVIVSAALLVQLVLSSPIGQDQTTTPIAIVSQTETNDGVGNYAYSFETANGIKESIKGESKQVQVAKLDASGNKVGEEPGIAAIQSGTISYPSPDGTIIQLS